MTAELLHPPLSSASPTCVASLSPSKAATSFANHPKNTLYELRFHEQGKPVVLKAEPELTTEKNIPLPFKSRPRIPRTQNDQHHVNVSTVSANTSYRVKSSPSATQMRNYSLSENSDHITTNYSTVVRITQPEHLELTPQYPSASLLRKPNATHQQALTHSTSVKSKISTRSSVRSSKTAYIRRKGSSRTITPATPQHLITVKNVHSSLDLSGTAIEDQENGYELTEGVRVQVLGDSDTDTDGEEPKMNRVNQQEESSNAEHSRSIVSAIDLSSKLFEESQSNQDIENENVSIVILGDSDEENERNGIRNHPGSSTSERGGSSGDTKCDIVIRIQPDSNFDLRLPKPVKQKPKYLRKKRRMPPKPQPQHISPTTTFTNSNSTLHQDINPSSLSAVSKDSHTQLRNAHYSKDNIKTSRDNLTAINNSPMRMDTKPEESRKLGKPRESCGCVIC